MDFFKGDIMNKLKGLLVSLIFGLSSLANAEVLEIYTWKANEGELDKMVDAFIEAKSIHESEGNVVVSIEQTDMGGSGEYQYTMRWDNLLQWGEYKDMISSSENWQKFWTKWSKNPSAQLVGTVSGSSLDSSKAEDYRDLYVWSAYEWKPAPGRTSEMLERMARSKSIIEKTGAKVTIYSEAGGGTGDYHFVMFYDNWTDMATSFQNLSTNTEWQSFNASNDPTMSTLISTNTGQKIN